MVLTLKVKKEHVEHKFERKINALRADITGENMYIAGEYTFWCRDLPPTYTRQGVFKFSSAILVSWIFKDFCFPVAALN